MTTSVKYEYTYDNLGNITDIASYQDSYTYEKEHYVYDSLNQLQREDHLSYNGSYTMVYNYDNYGNIQKKTQYSYQPGTPTSNLVGGTIVASYQYNSTVGWEDQLTQFNDTYLSYDEIGNVTFIQAQDAKNINIDGLTSASVDMTLDWDGRQLNNIKIDSSDDQHSFIVQYSYNNQGIRTKKIVEGKTIEYYLDGDLVIYETNGTDTIRYTYDLDGSIVSMNLNGNEYFYIKDIQGNITYIVDKYGNDLVEYEYDAYGNILHLYDYSGNGLGRKNPYRYRGYRYDEETGWYYLDSRYYNPEIGRFINADGLLGKQGDILGHNMYAYCQNNPVMYSDPTGKFLIPLIIIVVVALVTLSSCDKSDNDIIEPNSVSEELGISSDYKDYDDMYGGNPKYNLFDNELYMYAYLDNLARYNAYNFGPREKKASKGLDNFEKFMSVIDFSDGVVSDGLTPDDFATFAPGISYSDVVDKFTAAYHTNFMANIGMLQVYDNNYNKPSGFFLEYYEARYAYWTYYFSKGGK